MLQCPHMGTSKLDAPGFLLETVSALIGAGGLREFDRVLAGELTRRLHGDAAGLYLYNQSAHSFTPASSNFADPAHLTNRIGQLPAAGTMKEAAVRTGMALLCEDVRASRWTEVAVVGKAGFRSAVMAPLLLRRGQGAHADGRPIAVVFVGARARAAFSEADRLLLQELALQIAPVLRNVLATEERDALMALNSRIIVGTVTIDSLLPAITDILQRAIPHEMRGLVRFTGAARNPWFEPIYTDGLELDLAQLRRYPFERMAPAEMLATGKPVLITGYGHERFPERDYIESLGVLSAMLCPLTVRRQPFGFLAIGSRRRNAFSERDLALAEQVGHHLSQAIANILAYEEIRRLTDRLEQENVYLKEERVAAGDRKELVGESPALQKTLKAIEKVAPTDSAVLVTGETGTGKELVAQAIHQLSPRKHKPLIKVNCAALPPTLIETELFGHEKGAFTNATARKIGRFELADGGTIFLDEVGDIPLELQAKLLRVLEAHELDRVGGARTIALNVRVLAATNADLEQAVGNGTFRADLYYRLNVFPIRIPPLRERRDDIPMLARHFVKKYAARHRKAVSRIAPPAVQALTAYAWPGNVRELEHVIERAVILAQGQILTLDEFENEFAPGLSEGADKFAKAPRTLADAERAHILDALAQTNWVVAGSNGAAARLGLKRSTLQHRMRKLGILKPPTTRA